MSAIPPSEDEELQQLKSEIMFICSQKKHECLMSPAEKYMELLRDHFKYMLEEIPEAMFLEVVTEALEEVEGVIGDQATLSALKKIVKEKLTQILKMMQKEKRGAREGAIREQDEEYNRFSDMSRRGKGKGKRMNNNANLNNSPKKWRDTRRVTYNREAERTSLRASESLERRKFDMSRIPKPSIGKKKRPKGKKKGKKRRGSRRSFKDLSGGGLTYAQHTNSRFNQSGSNFLQVPKPSSSMAPRKSKKKSRRSSVANSKNSYRGYLGDGFSNSRKLRVFVKDAVKERHGVDELDAAILNRSLSQTSMRIFNEIREKERASPIKILDKNKSILEGKSHGVVQRSRDSTLSKRKRSHLIYDMEDRSASAKEKELRELIRNSSPCGYGQLGLFNNNF